MSKVYMMVTITNRNKRKDFRTFFKEYGLPVFLETIGRGTAQSEVLDYFGLEESEKLLFLAIVTGETWKKLRRGLITKMLIDVPGTGVSFIVPLSSVGGRKTLQFLVNEQEFEKEEETSMKDTDYELLENDSDKDEDIDDERNDKLELVMKCIGIGIAVIILMITIFVVIKLVGNGKNTANNNKTSVEATTVNSANNNSSDMVEVPAVVGMTKEDAIKALNKLGLGYKAVTQSSDTVAEDCVISQGNVGGSKVEKNSQIVLTISTGKENKEVTVPNVKGKSEQEAKEAIEAANLVASVDYQYSDSVEAGNVIKYSPSGSVAEGSTVTIHVSRGKKVTNVSVPNVLGMSESLASQTLDSANLKVTVKYETSSKAEYGTVTSQTPYSAGDSVPSGTTITIYVSHYQQTAQQTTTAANNKNNNGNSNNSSN